MLFQVSLAIKVPPPFKDHVIEPMLKNVSSLQTTFGDLFPNAFDIRHCSCDTHLSTSLTTQVKRLRCTTTGDTKLNRALELELAEFWQK